MRVKTGFVAVVLVRWKVETCCAAVAGYDVAISSSLELQGTAMKVTHDEL